LRPNTHISWLQWGRDQLIAEFSALASDQPMQVELQWGRDQLIAELRCPRGRPNRVLSFNGAAIN